MTGGKAKASGSKGGGSKGGGSAEAEEPAEEGEGGAARLERAPVAGLSMPLPLAGLTVLAQAPASPRPQWRGPLHHTAPLHAAGSEPGG